MRSRRVGSGRFSHDLKVTYVEQAASGCLRSAALSVREQLTGGGNGRRAPDRDGAGNGSGGAGTTGAAAHRAAPDNGTRGSVTATAGQRRAAGTTGAAARTAARARRRRQLADMIDNLDDGDARIIMANGRQGPWHSFNDQNGGNQQPPFGTGFLPDRGRREQHLARRAHDRQRLPVRRRRLRSQQLHHDARVDAEPGVQRERLQRHHVLGQGQRHAARRVRAALVRSDRPRRLVHRHLLERLRRRPRRR